MKGKLFVLFLFVVLVQPVAGMGVGFSIDASEPSGGIGASFTLSCASSCSGGGGGGGSFTPVVTGPATQEDTLLVAHNMTSPLVGTTTEGAEEKVAEATIRKLTKDEVDNVFCAFYLGLLFMVVLMFVGVFLARKRRNV